MTHIAVQHRDMVVAVVPLGLYPGPPRENPKYHDSIQQDSGSGSHEHDGPFPVVTMEKEEQTHMVHEQRFGERKRFAYKTSQPLPQSIIPAFHMSRLPAVLSYG